MVEEARTDVMDTPTRSPHPIPGPVLVSACLAGVPCRYDGRSKPDATVVALVDAGEALPVCAERLGGLDTPRPPAEIVGGDGHDVLAGRARVVTDAGADVTDAFVRGARACADLATAHGVTEAVLQARSPSCGCGQIHDGTHSGRLREGDGVLAAVLQSSGISTRAIRGAR